MSNHPVNMHGGCGLWDVGCGARSPIRHSTSPIRRGFTLIELILVMVIVLALLAMAGPRLDRFSRGRVLTSHAQLLLGQLHAARDRAASRAVVCRVVITDSSSRVVEQQGGTFTGFDSTLARSIDMPPGVTVTIERLDGSDTHEQYIEFTPTGQATPAVIALSDRMGNMQYILGRTPFEPFVTANSVESLP